MFGTEIVEVNFVLILLLFCYVFHRSHPSKHSLPDVLCDIERVVSVKLLGVFLRDSLSMTEINNNITKMYQDGHRRAMNQSNWSNASTVQVHKVRGPNILCAP